MRYINLRLLTYLLSHGQKTIERDFSMNSSLASDNSWHESTSPEISIS